MLGFANRPMWRRPGMEGAFMTDTIFREIPGGQTLVDWFGRVPRFHDANLLDIILASKGTSTLQISTWRMTDKLDDRGYYVLDKHAVVTIDLWEVTYVALTEFNLPGIIFDLQITKADAGFEIAWSGSYGVSGILRAQRISIAFRPGGPE
jgi:hypothetical protein